LFDYFNATVPKMQSIFLCFEFCCGFLPMP